MRLALERNHDGRRQLTLYRGDGPPEPEQLLRETPASAGETVFNEQISAFWASLEGAAFSPSLIQFLWVAERCIQLVAQNISVMPLRFQPGSPTSVEPAWLSNPDPSWYPNGVADAIFSSVDSYYRWGDAFIYVTGHYASGFPSAWTVLDAASMGVTFNEETGRRNYEISGKPLDETRMIQVSRNPRGGLRGTSAYRAYADVMAGSRSTTVAAADSMTNTPLSVVKPQQKIDPEQAQALQAAMETAARLRRPGAPMVLDYRLSLEGTKLGFSPEELMLVDVQEFWARVLGSACGVPPFMLNIALTGGLSYQNPAMLFEMWWRTELDATCERFARALTSQALPAGSSVWFDPKRLILPLDQQTDFAPSPAAKASPTDQTNVATLRPVQEVTS